MTTAIIAADAAPTEPVATEVVAGDALPRVGFAHGDWRLKGDQVEVRSNLGHWHVWGPVRVIPLSKWEYMQGPRPSEIEQWAFPMKGIAVLCGSVLAVACGIYLTGAWYLRIGLPILIGIAVAVMLIPMTCKNARKTRDAAARLQCQQVMMEEGLGHSTASMIVLRAGCALPPTQEGRAIFFAHTDQTFSGP